MTGLSLVAADWYRFLHGLLFQTTWRMGDRHFGGFTIFGVRMLGT